MNKCFSLSTVFDIDHTDRRVLSSRIHANFRALFLLFSPLPFKFPVEPRLLRERIVDQDVSSFAC